MSIDAQEEEDDDLPSDGAASGSTGSARKKKKSGAKPPPQVTTAVEDVLAADVHGSLQAGFSLWIEQGHTPRLRRNSKTQDAIDAEAREFFTTHMENLRDDDSEAVINKVQGMNLATQINLFIKIATIAKKKGDKDPMTTPIRSASQSAMDADSDDDVLPQTARRITPSRGRSKQMVSRITPRRVGDGAQSAAMSSEGQELTASRSTSTGSVKRKRSAVTIRDISGERRHMDSSDVDVERPRTKEFAVIQDSDDEPL